jgi:Protein of unknown function (DUF551)
VAQRAGNAPDGTLMANVPIAEQIAAVEAVLDIALGKKCMPGDYDIWARRVGALDAAIETLRAEKTGWQPIATAPRDGTRVWGNVGDDAKAMVWHPRFSAWVSSWSRMTMAPGYTFVGDDGIARKEHDHSPVIHEPTHWMPLPPPPGAPISASEHRDAQGG